MPQIHLPGKKPKDKPKGEEEVHSTVASADGTLRKLGEKDLLLQTGKHVVLRFRLLPKTKFLNKAGEPVRDSLMHAGDQLSVQVSPDDEETALRVILVRAGNPNERYTAELPVEDGVVRAPRTEDMSKPRTITTRKRPRRGRRRTGTRRPGARRQPGRAPPVRGPPEVPGRLQLGLGVHAQHGQTIIQDARRRPRNIQRDAAFIWWTR
jgi:hypothetical protein